MKQGTKVKDICTRILCDFSISREIDEQKHLLIYAHARNRKYAYLKKKIILEDRNSKKGKTHVQNEKNTHRHTHKERESRARDRKRNRQ